MEAGLNAGDLDQQIAESRYRCSRCKRELPAEAFGRERRRPGGRARECHECKRARDADRRKRARELRDRARLARQQRASWDERAGSDLGLSGNGRTALSAAEPPALSVEEWLVDSGFAERPGVNESEEPGGSPLVCVEVGRRQAADERGWRSYLTTDEEEPAETVVYCPKCASREFDSRPSGGGG